MRTTRRAVATVVSATVLSVVAACSTVEDTPPASTVEVFTWWAEGGETAGLDALIARFIRQQ